MKKSDLLPASLKKTIPAMEAQMGLEDKAIAYVKYFHVFTNLTWYVTEFDGDDTFFGLVIGNEVEWGEFTFSGLLSINISGLGIERDLYFTPKTIKEIKKIHKKMAA